MKIFSIWALFAGFAVAADLLMMYVMLSGKMGQRAQSEYKTTVYRWGGLRRCVMISLAADVLMPPVVLLGCLGLYIRHYRDPR